MQARDVRDGAGAQLVGVGREGGDHLGQHVARLGEPAGAAQCRGLAHEQARAALVAIAQEAERRRVPVRGGGG